MKTKPREEAGLLTSGSIRKKMLYFAIPVLIGNLFQQLYNTVDSLIVGKYLGPEALAAVTSTASLIYLVLGFFNGLALGAGTVIARHIGAQDRTYTEKSVHTAVAMGLACGIGMSILGYFGAGPILKLMGSPEDVLPISTRYLSIYFGGSFSMIIYNMFIGILQAAGDSKHPLVYLVISSIVNVILDILFIAVFGMGVEGAAIATVLSQVLSMIMAGIRLHRSESMVRLRFKNIRFESECLGMILKYGIPTGGQGAVIDLSNVLIQSFINSFGSAAMAGLGAFSRIEGFAFTAMIAFQLATATFVSQNIGAQEFERARKGIVFGVGTTVIISETLGILIWIFARKLLGIFSTDPDVIAYGIVRACITSPLMFLPAYSHAMSAVMRGIGKPMAPMVVMFTCWCAVRVIVLMTIGQIWHDILLICWLYPFTWVLSTTAYTIYALKLRKEFPWLRGSRKTA